MYIFFFAAGTWGLFENWHLKEDYKKVTKRHELAAKLQINIVWFAFVNLILGVFIFFWQLVYFIFNYAEVLPLMSEMWFSPTPELINYVHLAAETRARSVGFTVLVFVRSLVSKTFQRTRS